MTAVPTDATPTRASPRSLCLALQGGGSFGAFTWGVLDRLLEEDIAFEAVSGASAGAVNAVVLAAGLMAGGNAGARSHLNRFWKRSSETAPPDFGPAASLFTDMTSRWVSPYQLNPFNHDTLSKLLAEEVDFPALRADPPFKLLVAATSVSDGTTHVFRETELVRETVLASGCLPLKAQAVEIKGKRYWDGGYSANPPLIPLVEASEASEMLIVQIMPTLGQGQPYSAPDIVKRLEQVTFNGVLQRELSALRTMMELTASTSDEVGLLGKLRDLRLHHLSAEDHYPKLKEASSTDLSWRFLLQLKASGRGAAEAWLAGAASAQSEHPEPIRAVG